MTPCSDGLTEGALAPLDVFINVTLNLAQVLPTKNSPLSQCFPNIPDHGRLLDKGNADGIPYLNELHI